MKTYISNIFLVVILFCVFSCQKDDKTYSGPPLVSFSKQTINDTILYMESNDTVLLIPIQLNAAPQSSTVSIVIDTVGTNSTLSGRFSYSDTITIHAGKLSASFPITVKSAQFKEGDTASVTFSISNKSSIEPSANYKLCKVNFVKQSFSGMFVRSYLCNEYKSQKTYITSFIAGNSEGIVNTNFWDFPGEGQYVRYIISKNAARTVTIPSQDWTDKSNIKYRVSGIGTYKNDGSMVVNYILKKYPDTLTLPYYEVGVDTLKPIN